MSKWIAIVIVTNAYASVDLVEETISSKCLK